MFIFAWITLAIAAFTIIMGLVYLFKKTTNKAKNKRYFFSHLPALLLWIFGCAWYIFRFSFCPDELAIGMACGGAALAFIKKIFYWIYHRDFFLELEEFTTISALAFFGLAAVQHVWPHLVTF